MQRPKRLDRHRFALVAALATIALVLFSCKAPPASTPSEETWNATPPFFEVTAGHGATLQLLGTIHLGPTAGWTLPPRIETAIAEATAIVIEVDLREITEESSSDALMRHGILPGDTPLSSLISDETARLIEAHDDLLTSSGLPGPVREAMEPWVIMTLLLETLIQRTDYTLSEGVEERLMRTLGDREVISLETLDQQLGFFGDLPIEIQELVLQDALVRFDDFESGLEELIAAWRDNDQATLIRLGREAIDEFPELEVFYDVILDRRNQTWTPMLVEMLEDPARADTTFLVAVGAQHLVGAKGVPNLLRAAGYAVSELAQ